MSTHLSLTGLSPSLAGFPKTVLLNLLNQLCGPNPGMHASRFGLFRFRSPLLTESHVVFSSSGYLDVSVHRVPFRTLWIGVRMTGVLPAGFPHSDICGSKIICISPQLFAAYHVFLRLLVPRHPPCALFCLISVIHLWCITYAHASRQRTFMHVLLYAIALAFSLKNFTVIKYSKKNFLISMSWLDI